MLILNYSNQSCQQEMFGLLHCTVKPANKSHPRDLRNWRLNTGSLEILTGCRLMILIVHTSAYYEHLESINDTKRPIISLQ